MCRASNFCATSSGLPFQVGYGHKYWPVELVKSTLLLVFESELQKKKRNKMFRTASMRSLSSYLSPFAELRRTDATDAVRHTAATCYAAYCCN